MGVMIIPIVEKQVTKAPFETDGKYLAQLIYGDLAILAESLRVTPLSRFVIEVEGQDNEESMERISKQEWEAREAKAFAPASEALASIQALKEAIRRDPRHISQMSWDPKAAEEAITELETFENWLTDIGEDNRFYLALC